MKKLLLSQKLNGKLVVLLILVLFSSFFSSTLLASTDQNLPSRSDIIVEHDRRPTDLEYAIMSKYAYYDDLEEEQTFFELPNWEIFKIVTGKLDYKGVVFKNVDTRQLVIVHRGTHGLLNLWEDILGVMMNKHSPQKLEVFALIREMIKYAKKEKYCLSFTGHSLGAFLAELSVFFCHNHDHPQVNAVTFESPGSQESLKKLQSNMEGHEIPLKDLDIIAYVANPNLINTFNHRIGSLYTIEPKLGDSKCEWWDPTCYTKRSHTISNIVKHFKSNYFKNEALLAYYMSDWPVANWPGLKKQAVSSVSGVVKKPSWFTAAKSAVQLLYYYYFNNPQKQQGVYFKYADWNEDDNCYQISFGDDDNKALYKLTYKGHYRVQAQYNPRLSLSLKHFNEGMQFFLPRFYDTFWDITKSDSDREKVLEEWTKAGISKEIAEYLIGFHIVKTKDGDYMISLGNSIKDVNFYCWGVTPIHKFRDKLSKYLHEDQGKNQEKIKAIFSSIDGDKNRLEIDAIMAEKGAKVDKIIGGYVIGIDASLHDIDNEELVKIHRREQKRFIQDLVDMNIKVRVRVAEKGSEIGEIRDVTVKGVDVGVHNLAKERQSKKTSGSKT